MQALKTSIIGLIINLFLFIIKIVVGLLSGSVSIIADAVSNLSDFASVAIMMFSFMISQKPPDKNHPFGHARSEYLSGFLISIFIIFVGAQFLLDSARSIFEGNQVSLSIATILVLGFSIIAKIILALVYKNSNKHTKSNTIHAAMIDSRNDAIMTSVILFGLLLGSYFEFSIDGVLGVIVSLFVMRSGFETIRDSIDDLVGARPDEEIKASIELLKTYDQIYGFHDLLLHNYGVKKFFASVHIEVPDTVSLTASHEIADRIEHDFAQKLAIDMIVHVDPVAELSKRDEQILELIKLTLAKIVPQNKIHSLKSRGETIEFTLDLPSEVRDQEIEILDKIKYAVANRFAEIKLKITPSYDNFLG